MACVIFVRMPHVRRTVYVRMCACMVCYGQHQGTLLIFRTPQAALQHPSRRLQFSWRVQQPRTAVASFEERLSRARWTRGAQLCLQPSFLSAFAGVCCRPHLVQQAAVWQWVGSAESDVVGDKPMLLWWKRIRRLAWASARLGEARLGWACSLVKEQR